MQIIIDEKIAIYLAENSYFYIMHPFEPDMRLAFIKDINDEQCQALFAIISFLILPYDRSRITMRMTI
jgi:GMP reductase